MCYLCGIFRGKLPPERCLALRQSVIWFGRSSFHLEVVKNELQTELKENVHYTILHSQDRLTGLRNRQMHDATNKGAKFIIDYCLSHKIGNIVFGWNKGQSQRMEMGRKNNQSFATIPTGKLKERLKQLCARHGIRFHETEESDKAP